MSKTFSKINLQRCLKKFIINKCRVRLRSNKNSDRSKRFRNLFFASSIDFVIHRKIMYFTDVSQYRFFFLWSWQLVGLKIDDLTSTIIRFVFRDVSWTSPAGRRNAQWRKKRKWHVGSHEETKPRSSRACVQNNDWLRRETALKAANDSYRSTVAYVAAA